MKKVVEPKPKRTRAEVEQTIQTALDQGERPDLQGINLYGVNLEKINFGAANLNQADLSRANLHQANLSQANLTGTNLFEAELEQANLEAADLTRANLHGAHLREAQLSQANLYQANLFEANLNQAKIDQAILDEADLSGAYLNWANFSRSTLRLANFTAANLKGTNLNQTDLYKADFSRATLTSTNFSEANLNGCLIYGISAWDVNLEGADHLNLSVSPPDAPMIAVDNFEIARFITLLLDHPKIGNVVDIAGKQIVLLVGCFANGRRGLLSGLQDGLRAHGYLPISCDGEQASGRNLTNMLSILARISRFIIADLTKAPMLCHSLEQITPGLPAVPVQPLLVSSAREDSIFLVYPERFPWILETYHYHTLYDLLLALEEKVLRPAETKAKNINTRRSAAIEVEARKIEP